MRTTDMNQNRPSYAPSPGSAKAREARRQDLEPSSSEAGGANVGHSERLASLVAGVTTSAFGLLRAQRGRLPLVLMGASLVYRGLSGHCGLYQRLGINRAGGSGEGTGERNEATVIPAKHGYKIEESVTINRPAAELYSFWREVENLPKVMRHLRSVDAIDRQKSHWVADGTLGSLIEWDAEIFNDRENEMIAWRSLPGSVVDTAGSVHFKELKPQAGTQVTVSLKYDPPAGKLGAWLASLVGDDPSQMLVEDLRQFKQTMEAGKGARSP